MAARLPQHLTLLAVAALLAGCGSGGDAAPASTRLVDGKGVLPLVTTLAQPPDRSGDLLLGTNTGLWRVDARGGLVRQRARLSYQGISDGVTRSLDAAYTGRGTLLASGHPDTGNGLPQNLGLIGSSDDGRTWASLSQLGSADLHALEVTAGGVYGWDALRGRLLVSPDGGRTFEQHTTPQQTIVDLAVDPGDPATILLAGTSQLFRSTDRGRSWRPVVSGEVRIAYAGPGAVLRADRDGTIQRGNADGTGWEPIGKVAGAAPERLLVTGDPAQVFLALADGSIAASTDGGKTWKTRLRA